MKRSKIKHSRSNQVFYIFNTIFWIIFMFLIIYPLYLVCIASVSDPDAIVVALNAAHNAAVPEPETAETEEEPKKDE